MSKKHKDIALLVGALVFSLLIGSTAISGSYLSFQTAASLKAKSVNIDVTKEQTAAQVDPAVLQAAIDANPDADEVTVKDVNGKMVTQTVPKKVFLMGGSTASSQFSDVWKSDNGINWTQVASTAPWGPRSGQVSLFFKGKIWVIGGSSNAGSQQDVWSSSDGLIWTQSLSSVPWGAREGMTGVVYNKKMYIMGGRDFNSSVLHNDVWSSSDGITWNQVQNNSTWSPRYGHSSVIFQNKIWILGGRISLATNGETNDVWSSSDGITWNQVQSNAAWSPRLWAQANTFQNKIFINGGFHYFQGQTYYNDVWSSSDGITWTQKTSNAYASGRYGHQSFSLNNTLFSTGGVNAWSIPVFQEVWSSANGVTWTNQATPAWLARTGHSVVKVPVTFGQSIYLPGCTSYQGYSQTTGMPCWFITKSATKITQTSADLNGEVFDLTPSQNYYFKYSINFQPPYTTSPQTVLSNTGSYMTRLNGLTPNTTYMFQACTMMGVSETCASNAVSFTTLP